MLSNIVFNAIFLNHWVLTAPDQYVGNYTGVSTSRIIFQLKHKLASYATIFVVCREYIKLV